MGRPPRARAPARHFDQASIANSASARPIGGALAGSPRQRSILWIASGERIDARIRIRPRHCRVEVSPLGTRGLVLGKTLARAIYRWILFEVLLPIGRYLVRIELYRIHEAALFAAVAGFGFLALLEFVVLLPRTENGGMIVASLIVMPLVFIGGSFFPFEAMPGFLRSAEELTPNGLILIQLKSILRDGARLMLVLATAGISILVGSVFIHLAGRRARVRFLGE